MDESLELKLEECERCYEKATHFFLVKSKFCDIEFIAAAWNCEKHSSAYTGPVPRGRDPSLPSRSISVTKKEVLAWIIVRDVHKS